MTGVRVLGLDPSLTSFGIAFTEPGQPVILHRVRTKLRSHERIKEILDTVESYAFETDVAVIEGAVLVAAGGGENRLALAGLHWAVRHRLWENKVPYAVIPPQRRSKWLTGRGNASKEDCLIEALKRFGPLFPSGEGITGNDEADALTMAAMGADYYGYPLVPMPADRGALLRSKSAGITWPEITSPRERTP